VTRDQSWPSVLCGQPPFGGFVSVGVGDTDVDVFDRFFAGILMTGEVWTSSDSLVSGDFGGWSRMSSSTTEKARLDPEAAWCPISVSLAISELKAATRRLWSVICLLKGGKYVLI